jgi:hypothetical protein
MNSIMGLSSMASLGTLVKIRELHLRLSWERNWKQQQNQWKQTSQRYDFSFLTWFGLTYK